MDFNYVPFGQATWIVQDCGLLDTKTYVWGRFWEGYDPNVRLCFNTMCGKDHDQFYGPRNAECFNKSMGPYCQHGGAECLANAVVACSKKHSNNDWTQYAPFTVCLEEQYTAIQIPKGSSASSTYAQNRSLAEPAMNATVQTCVKGTNLKADDLLTCLYSSEIEMLESMAKETVPHIGVPFVRITQCNGSLTIANSAPSSDLVKAICDAACDGSQAAQKCDAIANKILTV